MERPVAELPTIGVVIVTYGAENFVLECLTSLLESGYPALRVVVVDNASPDSTRERVRSWAGTAPDFFEERGPEAVPDSSPEAPEKWLTLVDVGGIAASPAG